MRLLPVIALLALAACADIPALDGTVTPAAQAAPFPVLTSLAPVLDQVDALRQTSAITPASMATFENRINALRAKAARLSGPVIDSATKARMRRGIARTALQ